MLPFKGQCRRGVPAGQLDRLRALLNAGIALSSELSLDALLQRIVETAAQLTGARYAVRIVQESLTNIVKHAGGRRVNIPLMSIESGASEGTTIVAAVPRR